MDIAHKGATGDPDVLVRGLVAETRSASAMLAGQKKARATPESLRVEITPDSDIPTADAEAILDKRVSGVIMNPDQLRIAFSSGDELLISFSGRGLMARMTRKSNRDRVKTARDAAELLASGHAGLDASGKVVDVRKVPSAVPIPPHIKG